MTEPSVPGVVIPDTAQLRGDAARITSLIPGNLDAVVPDCPGWTLRDLVEHLGGVHRWAQEGITTGRAPDRSSTDPAPDAPPHDPDALARWFGDGAIALAHVLDTTDPDAPAWMPFRVERPTVGVWLRRQTHETSVHRWDAESAIGAPGPIEATLAADGIDEYFDLVLARRVDRDGITLPAHSLHVHCTDTPGEWFVQVVEGTTSVLREHRKGDAVLRGRAQDLLLTLWGRTVPDGSVEVLGDADAAAAWLALGGT